MYEARQCKELTNRTISNSKKSTLLINNRNNTNSLIKKNLFGLHNSAQLKRKAITDENINTFRNHTFPPLSDNNETLRKETSDLYDKSKGSASKIQENLQNRKQENRNVEIIPIEEGIFMTKGYYHSIEASRDDYNIRTSTDIEKIKDNKQVNYESVIHKLDSGFKHETKVAFKDDNEVTHYNEIIRYQILALKEYLKGGKDNIENLIEFHHSTIVNAQTNATLMWSDLGDYFDDKKVPSKANVLPKDPEFYTLLATPNAASAAYFLKENAEAYDLDITSINWCPGDLIINLHKK